MRLTAAKTLAGPPRECGDEPETYDAGYEAG